MLVLQMLEMLLVLELLLLMLPRLLLCLRPRHAVARDNTLLLRLLLLLLLLHLLLRRLLLLLCSCCLSPPSPSFSCPPHRTDHPDGRHSHRTHRGPLILHAITSDHRTSDSDNGGVFQRIDSNRVGGGGGGGGGRGGADRNRREFCF